MVNSSPYNRYFFIKISFKKDILSGHCKNRIGGNYISYVISCFKDQGKEKIERTTHALHKVWQGVLVVEDQNT